MLGNAVKWVLENKAKIGWALGGVAAGLSQLGYANAAAFVGMIGAFLMGGGHLPSDKEAKAKNGDAAPPQV